MDVTQIYIYSNTCISFQSKQKKIRDKYGDQDEDERVRKMEILAVSMISSKLLVNY